jgi:hypothetical protein
MELEKKFYLTFQETDKTLFGAINALRLAQNR